MLYTAHRPDDEIEVRVGPLVYKGPRSQIFKGSTVDAEQVCIFMMWLLRLCREV